MSLNPKDILPVGVLLVTLLLLFTETGPLKQWQSRILAHDENLEVVTPTVTANLGIQQITLPSTWTVKDTSWFDGESKVETKVVQSESPESTAQSISQNLEQKYPVKSQTKTKTSTIFNLENNKYVIIQATQSQVNILSGENKTLPEVIKAIEN